MSKTTQHQDILARLNSKGSITKWEAITQLGIGNLGARIEELRKGRFDGTFYEIETVMEPNADEGKHARYVLESSAASPFKGNPQGHRIPKPTIPSMNTPEEIIKDFASTFVGDNRPDGIGYKAWQDIEPFLVSALSEQRKLGGDEKIEEAIKGIQKSGLGIITGQSKLIQFLRSLKSPSPTANEVKKVNGKCSKCGTPKETICKCEVANFHSDDS